LKAKGSGKQRGLIQRELLRLIRPVALWTSPSGTVHNVKGSTTNPTYCVTRIPDRAPLRRRYPHKT
jgi:hypothetical protein